MEYDGREHLHASDAGQQAEQSHTVNSAYGSDSPFPAVFAYLGLGKSAFTADTAEEELAAGLAHADWRTRSAAAKMLEQLGEHASLKPLLAALEDEHEAVRTTALRTLGKLGERVPLAPLVAALDDPSWHVRAAAVTALSRHPVRTPVAPLIAALEDKDEGVRSAAAAALGALEERTPIAPLVSALRDNSWSVREAAALALGALKERAPLGPLLIARNDNDPTVREVIEQVLQQTHPELFIERDTEIHTDELKLDFGRVKPSIPDEVGEPLPQLAQEYASSDRLLEQIDQTEHRLVEHERSIRYIWTRVDSHQVNRRRTKVFADIAPQEPRHATKRGARLMNIAGVGLAALLLIGIGLLVVNLRRPLDTTVASAKSSLVYRGHTGAVSKLAWSPGCIGGAQRVASLGEDGTVQIWDAETGYLTQPPSLLPQYGNALAFVWTCSDAHLLIAYASADGATVTVESINEQNATQKTIARVTNASKFSVAAFSPDGSSLALALNQDGSAVQIWDIKGWHKGKTFSPYLPHQGTITALAWTPAAFGTEIVTASSNGNAERQLLLWNATTGQQILGQGFDNQHTASFDVVAMSWSPDGQHLAYAMNNGEIHLRSTNLAGDPPLNPDAPVSSKIALAWSPDSKSFAASTATGLIEVFGAYSGGQLYTFNGHTQPISDLAWSPNGKYVASAGMDGTVQVWSKP